MGDRANVLVKGSANDPGVYLYTHWGGSDLLETVKRGLMRGQPRWSDPPYLTRIIFCQMLWDKVYDLTKFNEEIMDLIGFGISTQEEMAQGEHPLIVLECESKTIRLRDKGGQFSLAEGSFEEFVHPESFIVFQKAWEEN